MAAAMSAASRALVIGGNANVTGRSLRAGKIRSMQSLSDCIAVQSHLDGLLQGPLRASVNGEIFPSLGGSAVTSQG
jgi:hypothetical protein